MSRPLSLLFLLAALALAACSSSSSSPSPTDGAVDAPGDAAARVPAVHRPAAVACEVTRPPGSLLGGGGGACASDAECTAGKNGRCFGGLTPNACSYDECATDAECGSAVCVCRDAARVGAPNACFRGNCRTDVDCPGNYCSPSGVDISWNCLTGVPIGSLGYFCHGAGDECVDHDDCGTAVNVSCVYDVERRHFRCLPLTCTR